MKRNKILQTALLSFAFMTTGVYANQISAEVIKQSNHVDGAVTSSLIDTASNSIYVSGLFRTVKAHNTGGGAVFNKNGHLLNHSPQFTGRAMSSVSDGNGGFYVGGNFSQIGNARIHYLAHIQADGHVDESFRPVMAGSVAKLAKVNNKLYAVVGYRVQQIDLLSGLTNHNFNLSATGPIYALAATPRGVYIGGIFRGVNGHQLFALAKASPDDGSLDLRFPRWAVGGVRAIQVADGDTVFASGYYTDERGVRIATVNKYNELTDQIDPDFTLKDIPVKVMTADHDWLYIDRMRTSHPFGSHVERFNIHTGEKDQGYITPFINTNVQKIILSDNYVYVAGGFTQIDRQPHRYIFRYNQQTREVDQSFKPEVNQRLFTASVSSDRVFVGGYFTTAGGLSQAYLAKFDLITGAVDKAFHPSINYPPAAMAIYGDDLYLGGAFTRINGQKAYMMARVSKHTGDRLGNNFPMSPNKPIYTMKVKDGYLYVGGAFTNISRSNGTKYLARYNLLSNTYDRHFKLGLDNPVWAMAFADDALYVGGQFTDYLRKYNTLSGRRINAFVPMVNHRVYSLAYDEGTIYATTLSSPSQNALFAYNADTGMSEALNMTAGRASTLLKANGYLYVANKSIRRMHLDTKLSDDSFNISVNHVVKTLSYCCGRLYIGGYFTVIHGVNQPYYAMLKL